MRVGGIKFRYQWNENVRVLASGLDNCYVYDKNFMLIW